MAKSFRVAILMACFFRAGSVFAAGGACPSGVPVTGNNCYFIAANGSDSNTGTSESSPFLHAPGMPNCSNNCASVTPTGGNGFILRGGDTWHFGENTGDYTGGTWEIGSWAGSSANCNMSTGNQSSCIYWGVDKNWYSGSSWARPILTSDNPLSTTTVSSCPYQAGSDNEIIDIYEYTVVDNFEFTGMCFATNEGFGQGEAISLGNGNVLVENTYTHGFSRSSGATAAFLYAYFGGANPTYMVGNVCDGSDSDEAWLGCFYGNDYYVADNYFGHNAQVLGGNCHVGHDNIFEYWVGAGDGVSHGNMWECVADYTDGNSTPNVWYNNTVRHNTVEDVEVWFCPAASNPEYWFNNIVYDLPGGNFWDIDQTGCGGGGSQFMFNNTLEMGTNGGEAPCVSNLTVYNQHNIGGEGGSVWGGNLECTGGPNSSTNIVMSHATANSQGYTGSGGTIVSGQTVNTCANETTPCAPTAGTNSTVGAGTNLQSYCTTLLGSSDPLVVAAGNACQYGTTDGCSYNTSNHTMNCPVQTAVARPTSGAWDSGAYQYTNAQSNQKPNPPTNLNAIVN